LSLRHELVECIQEISKITGIFLALFSLVSAVPSKKQAFWTARNTIQQRNKNQKQEALFQYRETVSRFYTFGKMPKNEF